MAAMILLCVLCALFYPTFQQETLDCNFDTDFCNWRSDTGDGNFEWRTGESVAIDGFHSIPRTVTGTGSFAYAQGRFRPSPAQGTNRAVLRSPQVTGLTNPATLEFMYWKTAIPPTLQVCTQDSGETQLRCFDTVSGSGAQSWQQRVVTVPANPLSFEIVFVATNFNTELDLLGIDDVKFRSPTGASFDTRYPSNRVNAADTSQPILPSTINKGQRAFGQRQPTLITTPWQQSLTQKTAGTQGGPALFPDQTSNGLQPVIESEPRIPAVPQLRQQVRFSPKVNPPALFQPDKLQQQTVLSGQVTNENSGADFVGPPGEPLPGACLAVSCRFLYDLCRWDNLYTTNFDWRHRNGRSQFRGIPQDISGRDSYIYVNGDGRYPQQRAAIKSEQFVVASGSYLQFYAYISQPSSITLAVYQTTQHDVRNGEDLISGASVVWQKTGYYDLGGPGWKLIRAPIPASSYPMTILLGAHGLSSPNHYAGLDDVLLVNAKGEEIGCAFNFNAYEDIKNSVSPSDLEAERLTAYQKYASTEYKRPDRQDVWRNVVGEKVSVRRPQDQKTQTNPGSLVYVPHEDQYRQQSANLKGPTVFRIKPIKPVLNGEAAIQPIGTYGDQLYPTQYIPNNSEGRASLTWQTDQRSSQTLSAAEREAYEAQNRRGIQTFQSNSNPRPNDSDFDRRHRITGTQTLSPAERAALENSRNGRRYFVGSQPNNGPPRPNDSSFDRSHRITGTQTLSPQERAQLHARGLAPIQPGNEPVRPNDSGFEGKTRITGTQDLLRNYQNNRPSSGLYRLVDNRSNQNKQPIYGSASIQQNVPAPAPNNPIRPIVSQPIPIQPVGGALNPNQSPSIPYTPVQSTAAVDPATMDKLSAISGLDKATLGRIITQTGISKSALDSIASTGQINPSTLAELKGNGATNEVLLKMLETFFGRNAGGTPRDPFHKPLQVNPDTYRHQVNGVDFLWQNAQNARSKN